MWNTITILWFNLRLILISLNSSAAFIFSSDITKIFYFNITINIIIVTDLIFGRIFEIFIVFFSYYKFFVKVFFITSPQYLFSSIILLCFKRLTKLISNIYWFTSITASNMFSIFICIRLFWSLLSLFSALKMLPNSILHKL